MVKTKFEWIDALIIALFLLSVYLILTRLFGHSATDLQIIFSVFSIYTSALFYIFNFLYKMNRELGEIKTEIRNLKR
jgi:hypothetical protein